MLDLRKDELELLELLARAASRLPQRVSFVAPNHEFFPDEYEPDLVSAGQLLHRLMAFAGLGEWTLQVVDGRSQGDELRMEELEVQQPDVSFIAAEGKKLIFQVTRLGAAEVTVAALAGEVARAALAVTGKDDDDDDDDDDDELAAAATIWLGFGLITLPAAVSYRKSSVSVGHHVITRQRIVITSALPSGSLAFLLAAWVVVRGDRDLWRDYLATEQAQNVERWVDVLSQNRLELFERLRLPYGDQKPALTIPTVPLLDLAELERAEELHGKPNLGQTAVRHWQRKTMMYSILGLVASVIPMAVLVRVPWGYRFYWLPSLLFFMAGAIVGSRRRRYYCGACGLPLADDESDCPKCGARFAGESSIDLTAKSLTDDDDDDDDDDEGEDEDDELTKEALAAGPHPDDEE